MSVCVRYFFLKISKTAITWPFFKLGTPNFAWKQIQTIPTDYSSSYHTIHTKLYPTIPNTSKFETAITWPVLKLEAPNSAGQYIQIIATDHTTLYHTIPKTTKFETAISSQVPLRTNQSFWPHQRPKVQFFKRVEIQILKNKKRWVPLSGLI